MKNSEIERYMTDEWKNHFLLAFLISKSERGLIHIEHDEFDEFVSNNQYIKIRKEGSSKRTYYELEYPIGPR